MSRKIYIIIAVVFTVVLSVSTFFIIRNHIDSAKQNEVYDNLAEIVEDEPPKENGRHFICTFNSQRSDTGRITIKFKSQFIIPVQFILFTCLDFDFLSFADFHVPLVV